MYSLESHWWSETSFLSKVILLLGKSRSCWAPNLASRKAEGWITWEIWCFTHTHTHTQNPLHYLWCMSGCVVSWWSCQSPVAHSFGLLNHLNSFFGAMFKHNTKFNVGSFLYLLSHFGCDSHTRHMLTQQCLPPPLTSTVKLSLFTQVHSSPLSLAARVHQCCPNCPHYNNNGWTFPRQTIYLRVVYS